MVEVKIGRQTIEEKELEDRIVKMLRTMNFPKEKLLRIEQILNE